MEQLAKHHTVYLASITRSPFDQTETSPLTELCEGIYTAFEPRTFRRKVVDCMTSLLGSRPITVLACTSQALTATLPGLLAQWNIDWIAAQELYIADMLPFEQTAIPIWLDAHNCEALVLERTAATQQSRLVSLFTRRQQRKMLAFETMTASKVSGVFAVSETEQEFFSAINPNTHLLPNGISGLHEESEDPTYDLLFTGTLAYPPNRHGLLWFLQHVWPTVREQRPDTRLCIVARSPDTSLLRYASAHIQFITDAEDIFTYLARSRIAIVPLHAGGGTRFKILEAFAANVPVISTPIGAEGIAAIRDEHLRIAQDSSQFAAQILDLLAHPAEANAMATRAAALVNATYRWDSLVKSVLPLFERSA
jgi:glycosyltransferase involved in cell wall biosynthesis